MAKVSFTGEQTKAIELRDKNLLVSAAAGSGKTAVLVERIIRRILDEKAGVDVDRLLIMTFTNAAAAQMREKIRNAIEEKRRLNPFNRELARQSALVHNAMITTIHGFCLNILKNHFNEVSLPPDFRIADEGEAKLLRQDALSEVLEEKYSKNSPEFIEMVEKLASGKTDRAVEDTVNRLYDFAMSYPEPEKWLEKCVQAYREIIPGPDPDSCYEALERVPLIKQYFEDIRAQIRNILEDYTELYERCLQDEGLLMYENTLNSDMEGVRRCAFAGSVRELVDNLGELDFIRFGTGAKKGGVKPSEEDKEFVRAGRDSLKGRLSSLKERFKDFDPVRECGRIAQDISCVQELTELTGEYIKRYSEKKREADIIDYSDMEHLALRVLSADNGAAADEYRELYEEVYVDEYQDSNAVQETLLKAVARDNNLFMVGDVKQSIYGFRLARPDIFIEKYNSFSEDDTGRERDIRIDLSQNFRSRREVIDAVNEIFGAVMNRANSGFDYDEKARLSFGAEGYNENGECDNRAELILAQRGDSGADAREYEALVIAERIGELMREHKVFDPDTGGLRPLRYSDIVILLRTSKGWDDVFKRVLQEKGIPVHVSTQEGYFSAWEVAVLLDFLRVIDNPRQDIPLAAVLRGPFGKMDDEELAKIRLYDKEGLLYDALVSAQRDVPKAGAFLELLGHFRSMTGDTPVYDILKEIIDGEYGIYVSALNNGAARYANLNMLLQKADDYGKTSYKGLFQFVRYVDMLNKYEVDYGEAGLLDENADVVRIMTIHKSKGLEFPVVFAAGLQKKYNYMDQRSMIVTDVDYGIGMEHVDTRLRVRAGTLIRDAISAKSIKELRAEELRILYVAMTRAKEKLILTATVKDTEKELGKLRSAEADSFLDIILYVNRKGLKNFTIRTTEPSETVRTEVEGELLRNEAYLALKEIEEGRLNLLNDASEEEQAFIDGIKKRLDYKYEAPADEESYEKFSVTELKQKHIEELLSEREGAEEPEELFPQKTEQKETIPSFISGKKTLTAGVFGTAVHRVFELWDFRKPDEQSLREFMSFIVKEGRIEGDHAKEIQLKVVSDFANSALAERMKDAYEKGALYREQPFVIELEGRIIQGIIDAFFIEDGRIVVVDYKTDRVNESTLLIERYELQLDYYAKALTILLDKPVKERIIYSTALGTAIRL